MATLTVQELARTGLAPTYAAAAGGGDEFANNGTTFLQVKNASGAPITVTIVTQQTVDGLAVADQTVSVPATTGDRMIGPFPPSIYNDANGRVQVTYSGVTSLTVGAFRVP